MKSFKLPLTWTKLMATKRRVDHTAMVPWKGRYYIIEARVGIYAEQHASTTGW